MKIRYFIALGILVLGFSSCGSRFNNAEELTVPILQAIQSDNISKLDGMLPPYSQINPVFANNKGELGWCYYNKYTKDYRDKQLHARIRTNMDIIKSISADNGLDWDKVEYTAPKKQEVSDSLSGYTIVTTNLKFPNNKDYVLTYTAAYSNNKWYLLDDIYFGVAPIAPAPVAATN